MKAKKDGKLNTSPDPYGVEEMGATKLANLPEYMDTRQMPGLGEFPNYINGSVTSNMSPMSPNVQQTCMIPTFGMVPKTYHS